MQAMDQTIGMLLEPDGAEKYGEEVVWVASRMRKIGFTDDYRMRFNTYKNAGTIFRCISNINADDLLWLSNKIGSVMQAGSYECVDNIRLCKASMFMGKPTRLYLKAKSEGCCGFVDAEWTNEKTGNKFFFGFNHGH